MSKEQTKESKEKLVTILTAFCNARKELDAFYESLDDGSIMQELPGNYHLADESLGRAIGCIGEYMGMYLVDELLS